MGQTILTPTQHNFLQLAGAAEEITSWFYLTGGTALSEFYLKHRLSDDLDFFSENKINAAELDRFMDEAVKKLGGGIKKEEHMGIFIYFLDFRGGEEIKVDFSHRPFSELGTGRKYKGLKVASLWDILVGKLYTILHRTNARDYVDFYFGYKEVNCDWEQVVSSLQEKYEIDIGRINVGSRLVRVKDVKDYPKMLLPFEKREMEEFFLGLAKSLEGDIFG